MKKYIYLLLLPLLFTACKNKCHDNDCQNGGACKDGICWCPNGYTGEFCQKEIIGELLGNYKGTLTNVDRNTRKEVTVEIVRYEQNISQRKDLVKIKVEGFSTEYICIAGTLKTFTAYTDINSNAIWNGSIDNNDIFFSLAHRVASQPVTTYEFTGSRQ